MHSNCQHLEDVFEPPTFGDGPPDGRGGPPRKRIAPGAYGAIKRSVAGGRSAQAARGRGDLEEALEFMLDARDEADEAIEKLRAVVEPDVAFERLTLADCGGVIH